ncbi:MAG: type II toxin-antitoxin system Phd/YefM family antitoxin [Ectothiorhodospiraceae bacterium]|nr:type II toxin-antitoxin system Phd/YefM family antitoxin [Ectothiorhodospiraceae bacterium]
MGDRHSIAEVRSNLPRLVRSAEHGKVVEITRRGEPVAVLIGRQQFERLTARQRDFSEAYRAFVDSVDLGELQIEPDAVFEALRDDSAGRDVAL